VEIDYRLMQRDDLETVLEWAAMEGWNPGLEDGGAFLGTDPEGFFLAEVDGDMAAAISVVNHSDTFSFLGLYICRPELRARGIGFALWNHAINHAGGRTIGLDGVTDQQDNYRKSGFVLAGSTVRFEGLVSGVMAGDIRAVASSDIPVLIDLDALANGFRKDRFLTRWIDGCETRLTVVLQPRNSVEGFATIRRCRKGAKIGPLIAPDPDTAVRLVHAAAAALDEEHVIVDVAETNQPLIARLAGLGFEATFGTARMYRGHAPVPGSNLQSVATLELG
jgi:hypothetical protein